jgi:uncharacterized damage-inducible protein DinB
MKNFAFTLALITVTSPLALAQSSQHVERARQMLPAKAVEDLIMTFEEEITNAAQAMPADHYSFSPAALHIPGSEFTKVRTFADEVTHVAQANYAIASNIVGKFPEVDLREVGALKTKQEILNALAASFIAVHKAVATITVENQNDFVDDIGVGPNQSKISEATWVAVHGFDHYGQMVEYLRMNGIVPPGLAPVVPEKAP